MVGQGNLAQALTLAWAGLQKTSYLALVQLGVVQQNWLQLWMKLHHHPHIPVDKSTKHKSMMVNDSKKKLGRSSIWHHPYISVDESTTHSTRIVNVSKTTAVVKLCHQLPFPPPTAPIVKARWYSKKMLG